MIPADEKIDWLETNFKVKGKRPFKVSNIPERGWVRDFFRALEGFKAWPTNDDFDELCDECKELVEEIIDHPDELEFSQTEEHKENCCGLTAEPILFIFLAGNRRVGKTSKLVFICN